MLPHIMGKLCSTRKGGDAYDNFVGKTDGKRSLRRSRHRWKDIIKTYI
jgi:hypothetical protein